jgi:Raffinose synthase or seed imbibition protein Sip1
VGYSLRPSRRGPGSGQPEQPPWRSPGPVQDTSAHARVYDDAQSRGHSAHVGQQVEVCYRWHALYGRRVRRQYAERRAGGDVVHVEVSPGVVIVVAAWMLDPAACAGMGFGAPRVAVSGLVELHHLLIERGFRRSCLDDPTIVQEERDEKPADTGTTTRGPAPTQHAVRFRKALGMSSSERSTALARLASLLLDAAGVAVGERDDDER